MDGFAVLQEIRTRQELSRIPVFVLTNSKDESHRARCRVLGCNGFYTKPITVNDLQRIIEDILLKATFAN